MFAKGVERPAGTEADNFTHGSPTESSQSPAQLASRCRMLSISPLLMLDNSSVA